jgi:peptidoglycan/LPS O-acetylase OafA/YrhL
MFGLRDLNTKWQALGAMRHCCLKNDSEGRPMNSPPIGIINNPAYHSPDQPELVIPEEFRHEEFTPPRPKIGAPGSPSSYQDVSLHSAAALPHPGHNRLRTLTALRFIASILIVLDHFQYIFWTDRNFGIFNGFVPAVSFFFMLSGFMLCHTYLQRPPASTIQFVIKRLARVWPLHALMALFTLTMLPQITEKMWKLAHAPFIILANLTLTHCWIPMESGYFSLNNVTWSLSTLMMCYLVFPMVLRNIRRWWPVQLLVAILLCAAMLYVGSQFVLFSKTEVTGQAFIYISPLSRFLEFFLGMCSAVFVMRWQHRYPHNFAIATLLELMAVGLIILAVGPVRAWFDATQVIQHALGKGVGHYVDFAGITLLPIWLFLTVFAMARGGLTSWLSKPVPVFLGELSFGIYMMHVSLIHFYLFPVALRPNAPQPTVEKIVTYFVILLILSYLSSRYFEKPIARGINFLLKYFNRPRLNSVSQSNTSAAT